MKRVVAHPITGAVFWLVVAGAAARWFEAPWIFAAMGWLFATTNAYAAHQQQKLKEQWRDAAEKQHANALAIREAWLEVDAVLEDLVARQASAPAEKGTPTT